jgi:hypothetical protein
MKNRDETLPALGLPPDTHFRDLHASDAGQCLIVGISQEEDGVCQRLFVRGFQERAYREIPWPEGCNAFVDPIVSHVKAELYVLGQLWIRGAGNCAGLYQVSLPGGQIRLVHAGRQDSAPKTNPPSATVVDLAVAGIYVRRTEADDRSCKRASHARRSLGGLLSGLLRAGKWHL